MRARLIRADCVVAMAAMDAASVDAIVTDPPYGLEFMGKDWDRLVAPPRGRTAGVEHEPTLEDRDDSPQHRAAVRQPSMLLRCERCGGNSSGEWNRCSCVQPQFRRNLAPTRAMQAWHEAWAREAFRVLKPGGHLLAFGGTRTSHRLVCAVEDAGFEVRDTICWLYGSGFPKSLAVDKAIDRATGNKTHALAAFIRLHRERAGLSRQEAAKRVFGKPSGAFWNWEEGWPQGRHPGPDPALWPKIKEAIHAPDSDWDAALLAAPREIVGRGVAGLTSGQIANFAGEAEFDLTAPATPEAERWQGWGTALKPAWEIVVVGVKPEEPAPATIDASLCLLGNRIASLSPANPAVASSTSSPAEHDAALLDSARWTADERSSTRAALCARTDTSRFESAIASTLSIVSSWRSTLAALLSDGSTSTTETASSTTTDLRILKSSLSGLTPRTIIEAAMEVDGSSFAALPAAQAFSAVASRLAATRTLSALATATERERTSRQARDASPAHEPVVVARKPLAGTVAGNVLEFGTGAVNIDATRIDGMPDAPGTTPPTPNGNEQTHGAMVRVPYERPSGRWPANVVLGHDERCNGGCVEDCPVRLLDEQAGERPGFSGGGTRGAGFRSEYVNGVNKGWEKQDPLYFGDRGGPSRFLYQAKASAAERSAGLDGFEPQDGAAIRPRLRECNVCGSRAKAHGREWPTCGHGDWRWMDDNAVGDAEGRHKGALRNAHPT